MIEVLSPGPLSTVQDLGRPGLAALGVGVSGAADRRSLRLANRLAGNPEGAAAIELTLGGLRVRFARDVRVALAGAPCEVVAGVRRRLLAMDTAERVASGEELRVGSPSAGVRTYLAVAGGIAVEPVLGSRSTDTLAGLGPARLARGDVLPIGSAAGGGPPAAGAELAGAFDVVAGGEPSLRITPGPRADWFADEVRARLAATPWTVTPRSDRVGVRLEGPALERAVEGELPPEGMVEGALQVPPDGRPVLFLADHPVTGGYPVIAIVVADDIPLAAQARPGTRLRFVNRR
ncbi:MAG TPA: biotin-dependent carboxyltransferase family protein [Solirubrobacteraceae bacterium]|nr:biotin-dependent carboxyltransferase family protein [Solirubrobacteraceae bacterium]